MKIAVSIVNYNTQELTLNCIKSIQDRKWKNTIEIWVVDNASTDDSVEKLKLLNLNLIINKTNLGFAKGHNTAIRQIKSDYILILNSDTLMDNGVIDKMVEFMEGNPQIGISSCKVLDFNGHLQPNAGDLPFGLALLNWLFNLETLGFKKPSFHRTEAAYYQYSHPVGWVSGNFMMIRKNVIDKVGYLNEDYFMYFEDVDYCIKAQKAGYKIYIYPEVHIKHLSGGSLDDPKYRQWKGELTGLIKYYNNHFGPVSTFLVKLLVLVTLILRVVAFAFKGNFNYSLTYGKIIKVL